MNNEDAFTSIRRLYQKQKPGMLRGLVALMLVLSLLTPKFALAASLLLGDGFRSVIICTGAQLQRVTVGPDGKIVSDITEEWVAPHCVLIDQDVASLQRAWQRTNYPQLSLQVGVPAVQISALPPWFGQTVSCRGPPLI